MSGIILGNIFIAAFIVFVLTASFAAFIPGAPFHSPLSDFIRLIFQIFPTGPSSDVSVYALSVLPSFAYQVQCFGSSKLTSILIS